MAEKLIYTMGEVAEMFDVKPSLIRYWESQFGMLQPKRNKKGNRLFTAQDVENLKLIYHLVKERGMTLGGAKKALKQQSVESPIARDAELAERLRHIRLLLAEVREDLKSGEGGVVHVAGAAPVSAEHTASAEPPRRTKPATADAATPPATQSAVQEQSAVREQSAAQPASQPAAAQPAQPRVPRPRRKKDDEENKELFAFYEQSLF